MNGEEIKMIIDVITGLKGYFSSPWVYVLLFVCFLFYIWKQGPISAFTADIVERKMYTKERNAIIKGINYLLKITVLTIFITSATIIDGDWEFVKYISRNMVFFFIVTIICLMIIFMILTMQMFQLGYDEKSERLLPLTNFIKARIPTHKYKKLFFNMISFVIQNLIAVFYISVYFHASINNNKSIENELEKFITIFLLAFVVSFLYSFIIKPGLRLLDFVKYNCVYFTDDKGNKWYIQCIVQKNYFLITSKKFLYSPDNIRKIIYRSEIINKDLLVE
jgi:hypothetical protein